MSDRIPADLVRRRELRRVRGATDHVALQAAGRHWIEGGDSALDRRAREIGYRAAVIDKMTIDELVESVAAGTDSLKIKRKNGRTLTTLVKTDGKWLADTLWFEVARGHRNPELRTPLGTAERAAPWPS